MVLGVYTGQIAIGIVLDMLASRPLQPEKVAGIVLVVLGLLSGETKRLRKVPS
jgi:ribosome biogenesis SPOUT family RNA methylase Rps3